MLAKIENNQYEATGDISFTDVTQKYLRFFDEIINDKHLVVHLDIAEDFTAKLHPFLADSLISNLLGNAIKYNEPGGKLNITVSREAYCISNTSLVPAIAAQQLYKRFKAAGDKATSSNGLGLAIVKKIVDTNHLSIEYGNEGQLHRFCLRR